MIVPMVSLPSLEAYGISEGEPDTLTTRLGYISEVVLHGSAAFGTGAKDIDIEAIKGYKPFLRECPSRVGPFDVLSSSGAEREYKVCCHLQRFCVHVLNVHRAV